MKKATRKIYLSIIFVTLSLLTMVATTFAWVGIASNASFERLTINLETDNEKSDYGVQLSLTGKSGDFHDSIDSLELQKRILINMGVSENSLKNDVSIRNMFNQIKLAQCTTTKDVDETFNYYLKENTTLNGGKALATLNGYETQYTGYFDFDVWIAIYKIGEEVTDSENKLSIFLRGGSDTGIFSSKVSSAFVSNEIQMPKESNPLSIQYLKASNGFAPGTRLKGTVNINPASAVRLSVQKAYSVDFGDNMNPNNYLYSGLKIFKYGGDLPSYDSKYDLYDFGGILPTDFNFARLLYNSIHPQNDQIGNVPELALPEKRGDVTFVDDGVVNHIVNKNDNVTTNDMIKLHFRFWFEGWDADCFEAINDQPVSVNINFSTKDPNEV